MEEWKQLKEFRKRKNWTQQELAVKLGVSTASVARWEEGKVKPSNLSVSALQKFGFRVIEVGVGAESTSNFNP